MPTEIEQRAEELAKTIKDLRDAKASHEGELGSLKSGMDAVKVALLGVQQAQEAANRAAVDQRASGREDLDYYHVKRDDRLTADNREKVLTPESGSGPGVRLRGYFQDHAFGDEILKVWHWGLLDDPEPRSPQQKRAQEALTRRNFSRMIGGKSKYSPKADMELMDALRDLGPVTSKIFADSSGIGATWVPDATLPELERRITVPTNLAAIFPRRVIPPGGDLKLPTLSGRIRFYKGAIPTTNNPADALLSDLTMSSSTFDTVPLVGSIQADRDALADSILPFADLMIAEFAEAARFATDDGIVNGDTAVSHQDAIASWDARSRLGGTSGLGTTADHRRRWLGLRPRAYDLTSMTTDQTAAQTWDGLRAALAKLSPDSLIEGYSTRENAVVLTSWEYFFAKMLDWDEFASFDKVGALASVLTGFVGESRGAMLPMQVGFVAGFIPVCVAYPLTADLAATGLFTGSGSTTGMLQLDRTRFEYVIRQGGTLEVADEIRNNTRTWVYRMRDTFRARDAVSSSIKDVHFSFNLSSS